ncbi:conserved hypothetical protein [Ricinus communis]|uniref:Uncharacterized protein n=1 Tax=Ricinus communis TaxID=3988 RepID=B9SAJ9_RICCO|nr:conserved hypothetical protein [Ricinus communis]
MERGVLDMLQHIRNGIIAIYAETEVIVESQHENKDGGNVENGDKGNEDVSSGKNVAKSSTIKGGLHEVVVADIETVQLDDNESKDVDYIPELINSDTYDGLIDEVLAQMMRSIC